MAVKTLLTIAVAALLVMGIVMQQFNPTTAGPLGILILFASLYVLFLAFFTGALYAASRVLVRMGGIFVFRRPVTPLSWVRAYYFASVIALLPVILLALQSVGGIGVYELVLVIAFGVLGCVYIAKKIM